VATSPYFVLSPNTILSFLGLIHGPDKTVPTPPEDWKKAVVDVVIPALNEEDNIVLCLASVVNQTMKPRRIILVDDGSTDNTTLYAKTFCEMNGIELVSVQRKSPIGKTPTIKRQAREFDPDVEFILDADTILDSENYIARTVEELYKAVGIASACGVVLPLTEKRRGKYFRMPLVSKFLESVPEGIRPMEHGWLSRIKRGITNMYRSALYMFLQKFIYHGQMVFFGTIINPVGCAVAYRRKYVSDLFDKYEPILGDDLTNSEDIFIGFAMLDKGYRNIQLTDVYAVSEEPEATRLPRQAYMWSSSFLQCCYYFDQLVKSPFKAFKRIRKHLDDRKIQKSVQEKRRIKEPYRQVFGEEFTRKYGRPMGWIIFMSLIEKIFFPTAILVMLALSLAGIITWEPLIVTVVAEMCVCILILFAVASGHRFEYALKGLLTTPMRYGYLMYDFLNILRFSADIWVFRTRRWRK
jgi:glycosyltransferase involved in cell wall biosynthesis